MIRKMVVSLALVAFLAGCGDPKIDGSSTESFEDSSKKMAESLNDEQKEKFGQAIVILAFSEAFQNLDATPEETSKKFREKLHGKTANDIIVLAEAIRGQKQ